MSGDLTTSSTSPANLTRAVSDVYIRILSHAIRKSRVAGQRRGRKSALHHRGTPIPFTLWTLFGSGSSG